jgi:diguanylate cyclase (GGDEF)-like protein
MKVSTSVGTTAVRPAKLRNGRWAGSAPGIFVYTEKVIGRLLASLRTRIVLGTVGAGAVLVLLLLVAVERVRTFEIEQGFAEAQRALAAAVAERVEPALVAGDQAALQRVIRRVVERGSTVAVVVFDRDHHLIADEPSGMGRASFALAVWPVDVTDQPEISVRGVPATAIFQVLRGREDDIGGVWTAVDLRPLRRVVGRFRFHMALLAVGFLLLCLGGGLIAAHLVVSPLDDLARTLASLARGEMHARHPVSGPEQIQRLARHVNHVAEQFAIARAEQIRLAADLDRQVEDRTRQLEQHNRVLRQIGAQDLLTGLPNRLGLRKEMDKYVSLCRRSKQPLAVIMLDLDGFKAYNDTLGHAAGDKLLVTVAAALKGRARASDIVARWGGDEFCILIPFTTAERALAATEGFIVAITDATRDLPRPDTGSVLGASAGVACFPEDGEEYEELINRADAALYRAKAAGKGRVFRASSPRPEANA